MPRRELAHETKILHHFATAPLAAVVALLHIVTDAVKDRLAAEVPARAVDVHKVAQRTPRNHARRSAGARAAWRTRRANAKKEEDLLTRLNREAGEKKAAQARKAKRKKPAAKPAAPRRPAAPAKKRSHHATKPPKPAAGAGHATAETQVDDLSQRS